MDKVVWLTMDDSRSVRVDSGISRELEESSKQLIKGN